MTSRPAEWVVRVAQGLALWAMAIVPAYRFFTWPSQIETMTLLGVLVIAGLLGLVAGASRIRSPAMRLAVLVLGILVIWAPAAGWVAWRLPQGLVLAVTAVAIMAAIPLAIWRRPPGRTSDGTPVRVSQLMIWGPILCMVGGPVLGLFAWLQFAPGDIYGTPLAIGIMLALAGLLAFVGYSAFYALIGRPGPSAGVAIAYAATVLLAPVARTLVY